MHLTAFDPGAAREARRVLEYNPYHGPDGKFASKGAAKTTVAYSGRAPLGGKRAAAAREKHYRTHANPGSTRLRQDNQTYGMRSWHSAATKGLASARFSREAGSHDAATVKVAQAKKARALGQRNPLSARRPEYRERVPQDPKRYTKRTSSGKSPSAAALGTERADRQFGSRSPRVRQDDTARRDQYRRRMHGEASRHYGEARAAKKRGVNSGPLRDLAQHYRSMAPKTADRP